jgi:hypothetical protein
MGSSARAPPRRPIQQLAAGPRVYFRANEQLGPDRSTGAEPPFAKEPTRSGGGPCCACLSPERRSCWRDSFSAEVGRPCRGGEVVQGLDEAFGIIVERKWPAPGKTSRRLCGISSCARRSCSSGMIGSFAPDQHRRHVVEGVEAVASFLCAAVKIPPVQPWRWVLRLRPEL